MIFRETCIRSTNYDKRNSERKFSTEAAAAVNLSWNLRHWPNRGGEEEEQSDGKGSRKAQGFGLLFALAYCLDGAVADNWVEYT
jgi:hypothetical protein